MGERIKNFWEAQPDKNDSSARTELLSRELAELKAAVSGEEELKKKMGETVKCFGFSEKLHLHGARTDALAEEKSTEMPRFQENFLKLQSWFRKADWKSKAGENFLGLKIDSIGPGKTVFTGCLDSGMKVPGGEEKTELSDGFNPEVRNNLKILTNNSPENWKMMKGMAIEEARKYLPDDLKKNLSELEEKYQGLGDKAKPEPDDTLAQWVRKISGLKVKNSQ